MKHLLGIFALLRVLLAGPQRPPSQRRPLAHWRWPTPEWARCPTRRAFARDRSKQWDAVARRAIAAKYGVRLGTICFIASGKTWRHVS